MGGSALARLHPGLVHADVGGAEAAQQVERASRSSSGSTQEMCRNSTAIRSGARRSRRSGDVLPVGLVGHEIRRELHEDQPQLALRAQRLQRLAEQGEGVGAQGGCRVEDAAVTVELEACGLRGAAAAVARA